MEPLGCSPLLPSCPQSPACHGMSATTPGRPPVNSLEAVRTLADLSPGALVLPTSLPTNSGSAVVVEKDFSKVTLRASLAACDPAISAEQQCRTWLCCRELERADPWADLFFQTFQSWLPLERQKLLSKSLFLKPLWDGASQYRLWMCGSLVINRWGRDRKLRSVVVQLTSSQNFSWLQVA